MGITKAEAGKLGALASREYHASSYQDRLEKYEKNPNICGNCGCAIEYNKRKNKFCSRSCAASTTNIGVSRNTKRQQKPFCIHCGVVEIGDDNTKYCSNECRRLAERKYLVNSMEASPLLKQATSATIKAFVMEIYGDRCLDPECKWDHDARPVVVELEHRDGNASNNSFENLTLLCPCCHSLTSTYKAKNKGNGRSFRNREDINMSELVVRLKGVKGIEASNTFHDGSLPQNTAIIDFWSDGDNCKTHYFATIPEGSPHNLEDTGSVGWTAQPYSEWMRSKRYTPRCLWEEISPGNWKVIKHMTCDDILNIFQKKGATYSRIADMPSMNLGHFDGYSRFSFNPAIEITTCINGKIEKSFCNIVTIDNPCVVDHVTGKRFDVADIIRII